MRGRPLTGTAFESAAAHHPAVCERLRYETARHGRGEEPSFRLHTEGAEHPVPKVVWHLRTRLLSGPLVCFSGDLTLFIQRMTYAVTLRSLFRLLNF